MKRCRGKTPWLLLRALSGGVDLLRYWGVCSPPSFGGFCRPSIHPTMGTGPAFAAKGGISPRRREAPIRDLNKLLARRRPGIALVENRDPYPHSLL